METNKAYEKDHLQIYMTSSLKENTDIGKTI